MKLTFQIAAGLLLGLLAYTGIVSLWVSNERYYAIERASNDMANIQNELDSLKAEVNGQ